MSLCACTQSFNAPKSSEKVQPGFPFGASALNMGWNKAVFIRSPRLFPFLSYQAMVFSNVTTTVEELTAICASEGLPLVQESARQLTVGAGETLAGGAGGTGEKWIGC